MKFGFWTKAAVGTVIAGAAILGTGASSASAGESIIVKRFLLGKLEANTDKFIATGARGTQNAFRDNVILLVFSGPVDFGSLDARTVKIGIPTGGSLFIDANGAFYRYVVKKYDPVSGTYLPSRTYRNRVIYDATRHQDPPNTQNPYGFEDTSLYTVTLPGLDAGTNRVVRSSDGGFLVQSFTTSFRTTSNYLQDYAQPTIVTVEANDAPGVPLEGRTSVDSHAEIIAFFSEPMLPSAFDLSTSFRVFNTGLGRYVTGSIRAATDGKSFTFRPAFGYGRNASLIQVTLAGTLTDRSGNPLLKGTQVNFTSAFNPTAPNYNEVDETFDTNTYEDKPPTFLPTKELAEWNKAVTAGLLVGTAGVRTLEIQQGPQGNGNSVPWFDDACHGQMLWRNNQMGSTPRTISAFKWRYYLPQSVPAATLGGVTILMGHNSSGQLGTSYSANFSDTPVTVTSGVSYSPNTTETDWISGPAFSTSWGYNGANHAIMDVTITTGQGYGKQRLYWRCTYSTGYSSMVQTYTYYGTTYGPYVYQYGYDVRFSYNVDKSEAQSKWYDSAQTSPTWLDPVLTQTAPSGTLLTVTYQGAKEDILTPGVPDPTTFTTWTTNPYRDLTGGYRFIRFHVDMNANPATGAKNVIDTIQIPFIYY